MQSDLRLSDWRGDVSVFSGQLHTLPEYMEQSITAEALARVVCPKLPFVAADKAKAPYALPCTLREALLVGKTLARAKARGASLFGAMRSASHVTEGRWIKLDLDGIGKNQAHKTIKTLDSLGIGYLLYSTHSHGIKPRNRLRLILFLDRALPPAEYKLASQGAALWLIGASLDASEGGLHQLAGVFMCRPEKIGKTIRLTRISAERYCVSADALLAHAPKRDKPHAPRATPTPIAGSSRISTALRWIDANDTGTWQQIGMALKALEPELGADALGHWLEFSESAEDTAKQQNNDSRYNPLKMWESFTPAMSMEAAQGKLFALARDSAAAALNKSIKTGELTGSGRDAVIYLEQRHQRFLSSLLADAGIGGDV